MKVNDHHKNRPGLSTTFVIVVGILILMNLEGITQVGRTPGGTTVVLFEPGAYYPASPRSGPCKIAVEHQGYFTDPYIQLQNPGTESGCDVT
jgi:hypothetical protein